MAIGGEASSVIEAPIADVYAIAADVEIAPRWQPEFKRVEVLERDGEGDQVRVRMVTDAKVRELTSEMRFHYDPPTAIRWEQTKGDLKSVNGSWRFEDLGDGRTRATYALTVDPGRILGAMLRGPLVGVLRGQLVDSMPDKLRREVERG